MKAQKVLVAYDGSETSHKALEQAKEIAMKNEQAEINVMIVCQMSFVPDSFAYQQHALECQKSAEKAREYAEDYLKDLKNNKDVIVKTGHASSTIVDFAKNEGVDLIIIGNRGLGGVRRFFLGSVSHHVVQDVECHVLVVKS
ncbi:universal stress protein [Alkalibacillus aidingensis]|uniref:universal stress protein n=1 Tax=Alkalibacillus aidingensis TaxID=2747607 RepID=UPI0016612061|nr:universal stress protein [Alkalibacillus aidingensis]